MTRATDTTHASAGLPDGIGRQSFFSRRYSAWLILALAVVLIDQVSKWVILDTFPLGSARPVTSFFQLVMVYNPGAAFSFLANQPGWQRWFFTILSLIISAILLNMLRHHQHERLMPTALSLIVGGAIGNVIDRLYHGAVVDFLYFHIDRYGWPAFNLADSAISLGVGLMLWSQLRPAPASPAPAPKDASS